MSEVSTNIFFFWLDMPGIEPKTLGMLAERFNHSATNA